LAEVDCVHGRGFGEVLTVRGIEEMEENLVHQTLHLKMTLKACIRTAQRLAAAARCAHVHRNWLASIQEMLDAVMEDAVVHRIQTVPDALLNMGQEAAGYCDRRKNHWVGKCSPEEHLRYKLMIDAFAAGH
jgi:hypothetical protein